MERRLVVARGPSFWATKSAPLYEPVLAGVGRIMQGVPDAGTSSSFFGLYVSTPPHGPRLWLLVAGLDCLNVKGEVVKLWLLCLKTKQCFYLLLFVAALSAYRGQ